MFPLPFTFLLVPFIPLYFLPIDKARVSMFLARVSYLPLYLLAVISFILFNLLLSPLCYIKVMTSIALDPLLDTHKKLSALWRWAVAGLPYLVFLSAVSLPPFTRHLFLSGFAPPDVALTEDDMKHALSVLKAQQASDPSKLELTYTEVMALSKLQAGNVRTNLAHLIAIPKQTTYKFDSLKERQAFADFSNTSKASRAYKTIAMKLMSYNSKTLHLQESIEVLSTLSYTEMLTYSRYQVEGALDRLS
jgi:hypothetical protein